MHWICSTGITRILLKDTAGQELDVRLFKLSRFKPFLIYLKIKMSFGVPEKNDK